jgi:hypothetical protein
VLLRLGELIARAEGAGALARHAQRAAAKQLHPKAARRLKPAALAAASRANARGAALTIATEAVRWVVGADGGDLGDFEQKLGITEIHRAQAGLLADLQAVSEALYARKRR